LSDPIVSSSQTPSKGALWTGRVLTGLVGFGLIASAAGKLSKATAVIEGFGRFGFAEGLIRPIGLVELLSVVLYLVPKTRLFGAILVTAYLGGAVCTHVRNGDPFVAPILLGVFAWAGLTLRDPRIRDLVTRP
jgi:hypothetical protein